METSMGYFTTIKDVEKAVGRRASNIVSRDRDIVLMFSGGRNADGSPAGDVGWRIRKW